MNYCFDPKPTLITATSVNAPRSRQRTGHFTTPAEVVASALRLLNSHEDWLQENREAISERLELSFEQSRNGGTYTPEQSRQLLAERRASRQ